ncbi:hypothetical protein OQA88_5309 [Cercophora sp. LCS_1]
MGAPTDTSRQVAMFNLDTVSGALTLYNAQWAGYHVHAPAPFEGQTIRVIRFVAAVPQGAYPLLCSNPDGQYTSGSLIECALTAPSNDGVERIYNSFQAHPSSPAGTWSVRLTGEAPSAGYYDYDVGMFFGNDCAIVA